MKAFKNAKFKKERKVISMKKIKKLLAVLASATVIASSSVFSVSAETEELFDVPEGITTMAELREYITEPVWISPDDYLMLCNQLTIDELRELVAYFNMESESISDRLVEYLRTNGMRDDEISLFVKLYYEGALQIYETGNAHYVSPGEVNTNYTYGTPAAPPEVLTETSGIFESGVTYFYNEETNGLIFDGSGKLTREDYFKAYRSFQDLKFVFFGKNVEFAPHEQLGTLKWIMNETETVCFEWCDKAIPCVNIFTYEGTDFAKKFDEYVTEKNAKEGDYVYYTVPDDTDPYAFEYTAEPLPEHIYETGRIGGNDTTYAKWKFDGSDEMGTFEINVSSLTTEQFELEDIFEITKDYNITKVYITAPKSNMDKLPVELQGFETFEEADAELLRLINEAKADEQPTEETMTVSESDIPIIADSEEVSESDEKITDLDEIINMINNFIDEENLSSIAFRYALCDGNGYPLDLAFVRTYHWEKDRIYDFILENNIDENLVGFEVLDIALGETPSKGDATLDGFVNIRDCAKIVAEIACKNENSLPESADYNEDGKINVRDASAIAKWLIANK